MLGRHVSSRFFWQKMRGIVPLVLLPILLLGGSSILILRHSAATTSQENNRAHLINTQEQVELIIGEMDSLNLTFSVNSAITSLMRRVMTRPNYDSSVSAIKKLVSDYLTPAVAARDYVHSLYIYMDNPYGRFLTSSDGLVTSHGYYDVSWLDDYHRLHAEGLSFLSNLRTLHRYSFEKAGTHVITIYKKFFFQQGVVVLNLLKAPFDARLARQKSCPGQMLVVLGADGCPLMQSDEELPFSNDTLQAIRASDEDTLREYRSGKETYQITRMISAQYGWTYLSITPLADLFALANRLVLFVSLSAIVTALLCLALSAQHARRSYQSVSKVFALLDAVQTSTKLPDVRIDPRDIYTTMMHNIVESFAQSFAEKNRLTHLLEQKKYEARLLELTALRSQINPHFLFNTLQSIYWVSVSLTGSPNDASRMIEDMTSILAYSMDSSDMLVPLRDEVQNTRAYISLQHMRYQNRFEVTWEIDERALPYLGIKLLLQPMLENAITHGMRWETEQVLHIHVQLQKGTEEIVLVLEDDGVGIQPEALAQIRRRLDSQTDEGHIGLFSCNRRLCLTFGAAYGLELQSEQGVRIRMHWPLLGAE
ncbi:MAG: histidine kinase [Clostridia bacterium]